MKKIDYSHIKLTHMLDINNKQTSGGFTRHLLCLLMAITLSALPVVAQTQFGAVENTVFDGSKHHADLDNNGLLDQVTVKSDIQSSIVWLGYYVTMYTGTYRIDVELNYGSNQYPYLINLVSSSDFFSGFDLGFSFGDYQVSDLDNDGDEDIVLYRTIYQTGLPPIIGLGIAKNFGSPTEPDFLLDSTVFFSAGYAAFSCGGLGANSRIRVGDLNGDGKEDLVLHNACSQYKLQFIFNTGTVSTPVFTDTTGIFLTNITIDELLDVVDLDCDNDKDILVRQGGSNIAYLNDGSGSFTAQAFSASGLEGINLSGSQFLDLDMDGDLDMHKGLSMYPNLNPNWYIDNDLDGFGGGEVTSGCIKQNPNLIAACGDCNDADPTVNPFAAEANDGLDNDCSGIADDYTCANIIPAELKITKYNATSAYFNWPKKEDALTYQIQYRMQGTTTWTTKGGSNFVYLQNLIGGTVYEYRHRAQCPNGWTAYSPIATFNNSAPATCAKPTTLAARPYSSQSVKLYWNYTANAMKYRVRYKKNEPGSTWTAKISPTNFDKPEMTLTGLTPGVQYLWQVQTLCPLGTNADWSAYSTFNYFTMPSLPSCAPPTPLAASAQTADVTPAQTVHVDAEEHPGMRSYPNPADAAITLEYSDLDNDTPANITILDAMGREVYRSKQVILAGAWATHIEIAELPAGIYTIHLQTIDFVATERLIVQ